MTGNLIVIRNLVIERLSSTTTPLTLQKFRFWPWHSPESSCPGTYQSWRLHRSIALYALQMCDASFPYTNADTSSVDRLVLSVDFSDFVLPVLNRFRAFLNYVQLLLCSNTFASRVFHAVQRACMFCFVFVTGQVGSIACTIERRTCDGEVAGSSLTRCTAEYGPGQAAHAHNLPLSPSSIIWCQWMGRWCSTARKVTVGLASHWPCVDRPCGL